jgi:hypothetical protein
MVSTRNFDSCMYSSCWINDPWLDVYVSAYDVMELTFTSELVIRFFITLVDHICLFCLLSLKLEVLLGFWYILHYLFYCLHFGIVIRKRFIWIGFFVSDEVRLITYVCLCLLSVEIEIPIEKMKHLQGTVTYTLIRIFNLICNSMLQI